VGLRVSSWSEDFVLCRWLVGFGKTHTMMWFDELVGPDEIKSRRKVTFGMFVWAVRCGTLDEGDLCANLGRDGGLLYILMGLCHGHGLVDVNVTAFIRCVVCSNYRCLLYGFVA
jgi:hypothetical protein